MGNTEITPRHKILLVDDDQDFLEVYWEILKRLPSQPEIHTASTGSRALALLESERFSLMIVDLNMPRMDGLQILSIVRRKFPQLRLVVLTSVRDEEFRSRAYTMGVDQFWQKPDSEKEVDLFVEALEALLHAESQGGFRGLQSKSLVDIIQLECMSQSTVLLRITNGILEGKIWIQNGMVVDAETGELAAEAAFRSILGWKAGTFELLPGDPEHERKIFASYQALLLETAQAMDEASNASSVHSSHLRTASSISSLTSFEGVQFVLSVGPAPRYDTEAWGLESPDLVAEWMQKSLEHFRGLGERLRVGTLQQITGRSSQTNVAFVSCEKGDLCVGLRPVLRSPEVRETMKQIVAKWTS